MATGEELRATDLADVTLYVWDTPHIDLLAATAMHLYKVGLFDAFNDTLIGALSDKTRTRWGASQIGRAHV